MSPAPIPDKWRPSLSLVVFVMLSTVILLPLVGLFFFRIYDNQLIRQTQAELIAQSKVLAVAYAREVEAKVPAGIRLGAPLAAALRPDPAEPFAPIKPALDLASHDLLARRPDARPPSSPPEAAYLEIGARLLPLIDGTQRVTLAGFRVLDPEGTVIAGQAEVGLSMAHVEEVAAALQGQYHAALRIRVRDKPPPPIYSISRGTGPLSAIANSPMSSRISGGMKCRPSFSKICSSVWHASRSFGSRVSTFDLNKPYSFRRSPRSIAR